MPKRTWQPKKLKRLRKHGFLSRMRKHTRVITMRRRKGRKRLSATVR